MGCVAMKIQPIKRIAYTHEKDERHEAEEKRIKLIIDLLSGMNVPQSRLQFLKLKNQRNVTLTWLRNNLGVYNSHHKDYRRAQNLINLSLRILGDV